MLSPADSALAERDRALAPGLRLLLDEEAFAEALARRLPAAGVVGARATYVRYKPNTNCLVAYRVRSGGGEFDVYAKALSPRDRAKLTAAGGKGDADCPRGTARLVLEDESVAVHLFPADAKLKWLPRLTPGDERAKFLRKLMPGRPDLWGGRVEALRYKPERRFVGRVAGGGGVPGALLKLYTPSGFRAALAGARAFTSRSGLRVPRLLGLRERRAALAFEWAGGESLEEAITRAEAVAAVERAGAALAELHAQDADALPRRAPDAEAKALAGIARGLMRLAPRGGARASALARELARSLSLPCESARPVHGDFYAGQVLTEGGDVIVLDLDEASLGDPLSDVGNFVAHLERGRLRGPLGARRVEELREAFLEGYGRSSGRPVAPEALAVRTAAALLKLAHHPFRLRERDWPEQTAAVIERAAEVLEAGRTGRAAAGAGAARRGAARSVVRADVSDPCAAAYDPAMPFLRRALDPAEALARLRAALGVRFGARCHVDLHAVRVTRHRPGRRCLVEYDLTVASAGRTEESLTLVGKARARGADTRCFRLMRSLREAGFEDRSPDGICVPEPVALVPEFHMWLQRKVPGAPSGELMAGEGGAGLARRIADSVVKLQRAGLAPGRSHTVEDELRALRERLSLLASERPAWRARLGRLMGACSRLAASLPAARPVTAHRDFYPDQVLADGDRLYLLDFDLCAYADPALDAGNFVAHLTEQSLRASGDPCALSDRELALEERFVELAGGRARASLRAFAALTLVRHVSISARIAERRPFTEAILETCERRLGVTSRTPPTHLSLIKRPEGISHATQNH